MARAACDRRQLYVPLAWYNLGLRSTLLYGAACVPSASGFECFGLVSPSLQCQSFASFDLQPQLMQGD